MIDRLTRRRFLRGSLVTAASSIALPNVVSAAVLGRNGATVPSDRICMGFVGLGGQGGGHLFGGAWTYLPGGYLARNDVQVLGVCDVQRKRAEDARGRVERHYADRSGLGSYAGCKAYDDIRELVANPEIDAVLIAAAYHAAATNSLVALRAGKDVYTEKPSCMTIAEGQAVLNVTVPDPVLGKRLQLDAAAWTEIYLSEVGPAEGIGFSTARRCEAAGRPGRRGRPHLRLQTGNRHL